MAMRVEFLRPEKHGMAERQALYFANALAFRLYLTCKTLTEIFKLYLEDSLYPWMYLLEKRRAQAKGPLFWECLGPNVVHNVKINGFLLILFIYLFFPWYLVVPIGYISRIIGKRVKNNSGHFKKWNANKSGCSVFWMSCGILHVVSAPPTKLRISLEVFFECFKEVCKNQHHMLIVASIHIIHELIITMWISLGNQLFQDLKWENNFN